MSNERDEEEEAPIEQPPGRHPLVRHARRVGVAVIGGTVLLLGIALLVLPGPAVVVIPAGLAILGLEFQWSRRLLKRARSMLKRGSEK